MKISMKMKATALAALMAIAGSAADGTTTNGGNDKPVETTEYKLGPPEDLLKLDSSGLNLMGKGLWGFQLSPDGKWLLYIESTELVPRPERRPFRVSRLMLRNLENGEEQPLPVPGYLNPILVIRILTVPVFDPASKRLVIHTGEDANKDGMWDVAGGEKARIVVYDLASKELTPVAIPNHAQLPMFDHTGTNLIVQSTANLRDAGSTVLYLWALKTSEGKPLTVKFPFFIPLAACPTAPLVPLAGFDLKTKPPRRIFSVHDTEKDREVAVLPMHPRNQKLDDYPPQWSSDGKYLFYVDRRDVDRDLPKDQRRPEYFTRVYDRATWKQVAQIEDHGPVAPGPTPTTFVLLQRSSRHFSMYDLATGTLTPLGDESMTVLSTRGKWLVYATQDGRRGPVSIHRAEMMPDK